MKNIIIGFLIFTSIIFAIEHTGIAGMTTYQPAITTNDTAANHTIVWQRTAYPCRYKIEVFTKTPSEAAACQEPLHKIATYYTFQNTYPLNLKFPNNSYWRVSAQGLFSHPLGQPSDDICLAELNNMSPHQIQLSQPLLTSEYSIEHPAANPTLLTWDKVPGAVYYELEISRDCPPQADSSSANPVFSSREVYTNAYNGDLSRFAGQTLYWRVRAYNSMREPIGLYSAANTLYIDAKDQEIPRPLIRNRFDNMPVPLYPVYSWIPVSGVTYYEVEVWNGMPDNADGDEVSSIVWDKTIFCNNDLYDESPRIGTFFWRVRGVDSDGQPVTEWSEAASYTCNPPDDCYAATFGDSITHGGGCISYAPSDPEYSFQTYLDFPVMNLGKSGDTSESLAARFDRDVLPFHPRYLIIMGGSNSLREGVGAEAVIQDLISIRNNCQAHGIRPIFLTLPPINPANIAHAFNEETVENWQDEFSAVNDFIRHQRYYIDIAPYFADSNGELPTYYAADGLHYDIDGKKLMAQIINANWANVTR